MRAIRLLPCIGMLCIVLGCASGAARARRDAPPSDGPADAAGALQVAKATVAALDALEWDEFRAALAPDVTVFMPLSRFPARLDGREAVEVAFRAFFDAVRASRAARGVTRPPFLGLAPRDWHLQSLAPGAALVTVQLGPADAPPGRRTFVLRRGQRGTWEIVHLHASPAPRAEGSVPSEPKGQESTSTAHEPVMTR